MGEDLFSTLSMDNHHPSTLLSMDSCLASQDDDFDRPPDINLPLSLDNSLTTQLWNSYPYDILDVSLGSHMYDTSTTTTTTESITTVPKAGKKCLKRMDSIWGAWVFFTFYFKPVFNEKSKIKITRDTNGVAGFDKSDLQLNVFLVQHDMENMYMWVFKEKPENALGKMQLRSYMNGHSRQGERPFPFSVDKGFVRSHRMQRKHYRGLSNPQCVHGIEVVHSPSLMGLDEEERKRWKELTGRDFNFFVPPEASDFGSWRNLPTTEFELERRPPQLKSGSCGTLPQPKKLFDTASLNLTTQLPNHVNGDGTDLLPVCSPVCNKRRKDSFLNGTYEDCCLPVNSHFDLVLDMGIQRAGPVWCNEFNGAMRNIYGPVTATKTIYEDEDGYLLIVSLPFVDVQSVKVTWRNTVTHGIVKISCVSTVHMPLIKRHDRTFKLTDPSPEQCPPGEFTREIQLATRIPEDAKLEAYFEKTRTVLEIMVPKYQGPEEHEVRVCLRPPLASNEILLT